MLENAGLIAYFITRLDPIHSALGWFFILACVFMIVAVFYVYFDDSLKTHVESWAFLKPKMKTFLWVVIPVLLLKAIIPNRDDGIIIVSTQAGANAVIQSGVALKDIGESEMTAKLLELATAKIDHAIAEAKAADAKPAAK